MLHGEGIGGRGGTHESFPGKLFFGVCGCDGVCRGMIEVANEDLLGGWCVKGLVPLGF